MGRSPCPQQRCIGGICYTLTYKKVRNVNLRIGPDGNIRLSAPRQVPVSEIDRFVASRREWIESAQQRMRSRQQKAEEPVPCSDEECLAFFTGLSDRFFPLFSAVLSEKPKIRVRLMKSRWGSCCPETRTITLNTRLLNYPPEAAEYVMLHEYIHFIHPDHQKGFYELLSRLMPDYARRRALLKG